MSRVRLGLIFVVLSLLGTASLLPAQKQQPVPPQPPTPANPASPEETTLKGANLPNTGDGLLDFFRKRTTDAPADKVRGAIKQLGDKDAGAREKAVAELVSYGPGAVPHLRQAANDLDEPEIGQRARDVLALLDGASGVEIASAAAKQLAVTRPDGAAEVLLAYLPFAEDDTVVEEIGKALQAVGYKDGKPDPALVKALKNDVPIRRAVAAEVLSRAVGPTERSAVRQLLEDPKPSVRLRAALALGEARDAEGVGVLISLLGEVPQAQSKQIEDFLTDFAGEYALTVPQGQDEIARKMRREVWSAWWKVTDGPTLLAEFKKRALADDEREKAVALIKQLGDENVETREKALSELQAKGAVVLPLVRQAATGADAKVAGPAQKALQVLERDNTLTSLPASAPRLLAVRKPAGAIEALLDYAPFVEEEAVLSEVQNAVAALAVRDGKIETSLLKAISDRLPLRRAMAAEAICKVATPEQRTGVRNLLKDGDLTVRMRAAMALATARDKEAVPVLISLLGDLQSEQGYQVEEFLLYLAADSAPSVGFGTDDAARTKAKEAWTAWWRDNENKVDLARLDNPQRSLGFTLVVEQYNPQKGTGRVLELDSRGKVRWELGGMQYPIDAQWLPGDKVLVVEQSFNRVSERDSKNAILWQKAIPHQIIGAERLRNGNTFIASRGQLLEVTKDGKEVFNYNIPNQDVVYAQRMRDGTVAMLTYNYQYTRVDAAGKQLTSFRVGPFPNGIPQNGVEFLPNDHILICQYNQNKVLEYDEKNKVVWEANVTLPSSAVRLPNGRTLVASVGRMVIQELDRNGKVVWEFKDTTIRPYRVKRR